MADAKMEIGFEEEIELLRMNAPIPARGAGLLVGDFNVDIRDLRRATAFSGCHRWIGQCEKIRQNLMDSDYPPLMRIALKLSTEAGYTAEDFGYLIDMAYETPPIGEKVCRRPPSKISAKSLILLALPRGLEPLFSP